MAEAWLVCEIYVKYPDEALVYIKDNCLNKFTHNKAISKIININSNVVGKCIYCNNLNN